MRSVRDETPLTQPFRASYSGLTYITARYCVNDIDASLRIIPANSPISQTVTPVYIPLMSPWALLDAVNNGTIHIYDKIYVYHYNQCTNGFTFFKDGDNEQHSRERLNLFVDVEVTKEIQAEETACAVATYGSNTSAHDTASRDGKKRESIAPAPQDKPESRTPGMTRPRKITSRKMPEVPQFMFFCRPHVSMTAIPAAAGGGRQKEEDKVKLSAIFPTFLELVQNLKRHYPKKHDLENWLEDCINTSTSATNLMEIIGAVRTPLFHYSGLTYLNLKLRLSSDEINACTDEELEEKMAEADFSISAIEPSIRVRREYKITDQKIVLSTDRPHLSLSPGVLNYIKLRSDKPDLSDQDIINALTATYANFIDVTKVIGVKELPKILADNGLYFKKGDKGYSLQKTPYHPPTALRHTKQPKS